MKKSTKLVWLIVSSVIGIAGWFLPLLGRRIYQSGSTAQGIGGLIVAIGPLLFLGGTICAISFLIYLFVKEKPATVEQGIYGGLWKRGCAGFIDGMIVGIPLVIIVSLFIAITGIKLQEDGGIPPQYKILWGCLTVLFPVVWSLTYLTFTVGKYGASLGKKALKLKIIKVDGSPLGYRGAFLRSLAMLMYQIPFRIGGLLTLVSAGMIYFDKKKQSLHDKVCKTVVIYEGNA